MIWHLDIQSTNIFLIRQILSMFPIIEYNNELQSQLIMYLRHFINSPELLYCPIVRPHCVSEPWQIPMLIVQIYIIEYGDWVCLAFFIPCTQHITAPLYDILWRYISWCVCETHIHVCNIPLSLLLVRHNVLWIDWMKYLFCLFYTNMCDWRHCGTAHTIAKYISIN
jgi:hypothetical protein